MTTLETAIAAIKSGSTSLYAAKRMMGEEITESDAATLEAVHDAVMDDVCAHQTRMDRVIRRSY